MTRLSLVPPRVSSNLPPRMFFSLEDCGGLRSCCRHCRPKNHKTFKGPFHHEHKHKVSCQDYLKNRLENNVFELIKIEKAYRSFKSIPQTSPQPVGHSEERFPREYCRITAPKNYAHVALVESTPRGATPVATLPSETSHAQDWLGGRHRMSPLPGRWLDGDHILCACPAVERIRFSMFGRARLLPEDLDEISPLRLSGSLKD
ncbi:hypothetical protein NQ317_007597 [Molorchus minor]|uniref:Uncharacterized protein n=1 Tax=Molorchus minor TaxID=1323400 RepID=A0ABQ9IW93_9CUCU|nr:hypothetical protein NQ317_007597 [Molorchus minor]